MTEKNPHHWPPQSPAAGVSGVREKICGLRRGRGGGKSWAVRTKAKLLALRYPGIRLLLVRRTYQELEANHIRFLRRELANLAEYRATARQFAFSPTAACWTLATAPPTATWTAIRARNTT